MHRLVEKLGNLLEDFNQMSSDLAKWIIVAIAILGFAFNTGIMWNDVKHLKKSVDDIWKEINEIKKFLLEEK